MYQASYEETVNFVYVRISVHEGFSLFGKSGSESGRKIRFGTVFGKLRVFREKTRYQFRVLFRFNTAGTVYQSSTGFYQTGRRFQELSLERDKAS